MNISLSLYSPLWLLVLAWSVVAIIFSVVLPGWLLAQACGIQKGWNRWLVAVGAGIVMWAAQGVILGYLQLRWLTYGYLGLAGWWLWKKRHFFLQELVSIGNQVKSQPVWLWSLFSLGTVVQVLPLIASGWLFPDGVHFYRINAYDSVMHLAYSQLLTQQFPPVEPGAHWLPLVNYHYWSDVFIAELARVWRLPISWIFFQVMPVILSLLTAIATFRVVQMWGGNRTKAVWSVFFVYAAGELTYAMLAALGHPVHFRTPAIDNGAMQFLNMPHSFAKAVFMVGLLVLTQWWKTKRNQRTLALLALTLLLQASLVGMKVYFGMFAAIGLSLGVALVSLQAFGSELRTTAPLLTKIARLFKSLQLEFVLLAGTAGVMALIFFPVNQHAGGLIYSPLEWPKLFLGSENLNWREWWLRQQVYEAAGNTRNSAILNGVAILICLAAIHGTRLLGLWPNRWWKHLGWPMTAYLIPATLIFTWLGLFTLQESGLFNVFNFFAVSTIPLALAAGWQLSSWWETRRLLLRLAVTGIVVLTIPRVVHTTWFYLDTYTHNKVEQTVTRSELELLTFVTTNTASDAIIQTHPENTWDKTTPYVAYFSNRPTYLTGVGMMDTHNQPVRVPYLEMKAAFQQMSGLALHSYLRDRGINYVYIRTKPEENVPFPISDLGKIVFQNEAGWIIEL